MLIAIGITLYFWRTNIIGIHESSEKALRIMQLTTVMGLLIFRLERPHALAHAARHAFMRRPFTPDLHANAASIPTKQASSGWLEHFPRILGAIGVLVGVRAFAAGDERRRIARPGQS